MERAALASTPSRSMAPDALPSSSSSSAPSALPTPGQQQWLSAWQLAQGSIASSSPNPSWDPVILRSAQVDAQRLDNELASLIKEQFMRIFTHFTPGRVASLEPELAGLLSALIYGLSIWRAGATPGSQLLNLRYRNERSAAAAGGSAAGGRTGVEGPGLSLGQKLAFGAGHVLIPYLWSRLTRLAAQQQPFAAWPPPAAPQPQPQPQAPLSSSGWSPALRQRAWQALRWLGATYRLASILNFCAFLRTGRYRSLLERLAGARLVYVQPSMSRVISFEYLNRQLVWQELSEFLLFLLPLVDPDRIKALISRYLPALPAALALGATSSAAQPPTAGALQAGPAPPATPAKAPPQQQEAAGPPAPGQEQEAGVVAQHPSVPCPICGTAEILTPYVAMPCEHLFCYYCLRAHCAADKGFRCPVCRVRVSAMTRWKHGRRSLFASPAKHVTAGPGATPAATPGGNLGSSSRQQPGFHRSPWPS